MLAMPSICDILNAFKRLPEQKTQLRSKFLGVYDCQSNQKFVIHEQTDIEQHDEPNEHPDSHLCEFSDDCIQMQNPTQHGIHGENSNVEDNKLDANAQRFAFQFVQIPFDDGIVPQKDIKERCFFINSEN